MKVLTVTTGNILPISPFISDHVEKLSERNIQVDYFLVKGKGIWGYLKNLRPLLNKIEAINPDIIHAHYGLSGLLCSLQRKVPVVTTFHGSDINLSRIRLFSKLAYHLSHSAIFVSKDLADKIRAKKYYLIPCGVNFDVFKPESKEKARRKMNLSLQNKYILFSSSFHMAVKNYPLAKSAMEYMGKENVELIELKGFSREQVALLLNAADLALMTSISEGSPQFIKEALACNTPIVTTDVGDVSILLNDVKGCYICDPDPKILGEAIQKSLRGEEKTDGRKRIDHLDANTITDQIIAVYQKVIALKQ